MVFEQKIERLGHQLHLVGIDFGSEDGKLFSHCRVEIARNVDIASTPGAHHPARFNSIRCNRLIGSNGNRAELCR